MRAAVLDGTAGTEPLGRAAVETLAPALDRAGWAREFLELRSLAIASCTGCFGCWIRTPGGCIIPDEGRRVAEEVIRSGLTVWVTPVTFGGYSSLLKGAVDRLIPLIHPHFLRIEGEVHHRLRYERSPSLVALGLLERPDPEASEIFASLVARNALNLRAPGHAVATVWPGQEAELPALWEKLLGRAGVIP